MDEKLLEQAIEKLEACREDAKKNNFEPIIDFLIGRSRESESLAQDIVQEHKTWDKCKSHVKDMARNYLSGKSGCVLDATVFEWAEDYFHLDDKAAAEKAKKEAEKKKKKAEEAAAKAAEEKAKKKEAAAAKKAEEKAKKKEVEGQMDLFSMFGDLNG